MKNVKNSLSSPDPPDIQGNHKDFSQFSNNAETGNNAHFGVHANKQSHGHVGNANGNGFKGGQKWNTNVRQGSVQASYKDSTFDDNHLQGANFGSEVFLHKQKSQKYSKKSNSFEQFESFQAKKEQQKSKVDEQSSKEGQNENKQQQVNETIAKQNQQDRNLINHQQVKEQNDQKQQSHGIIQSAKQIMDIITNNNNQSIKILINGIDSQQIHQKDQNNEKTHKILNERMETIGEQSNMNVNTSQISQNENEQVNENIQNQVQQNIQQNQQNIQNAQTQYLNETPFFGDQNSLKVKLNGFQKLNQNSEINVNEEQQIQNQQPKDQQIDNQDHNSEDEKQDNQFFIEEFPSKTLLPMQVIDKNENNINKQIDQTDVYELKIPNAQKPGQNSQEKVEEVLETPQKQQLQKPIQVSLQSKSVQNQRIALEKMQRVTQNRMLLESKQFLETLKLGPGMTPQKESQPPTSSEKHNRTNSVALSHRMSSAQSQRIKSALSKKSSQNDESFNLDLTTKTKNSKSSFRVAKIDSLLYSAESGFGFHPGSPNKTQRQTIQKEIQSQQIKAKTPNKMHKLEELEEFSEKNVKKQNIHKRFSQNVENQFSPRIRKLMSEKDNIQEFCENEGENSDKEHQQVVSSKENNQSQSTNKINQNNQNKENEQNGQFRQNQQNKQNLQNLQRKSEQENIEQIGNLQNTSKLSNNSHTLLQNKQQGNGINGLSSEGARFGANANEIENSNVNQNSNINGRDSFIDGVSLQDDRTLVDAVENFGPDDESFDQNHRNPDFQKNFDSQNMQNIANSDNESKKAQLESQIKRTSFKSKKQNPLISPSSNRNSSVRNLNNNNIFSTEISNYNRKIQKIKQEKETKKKYLQNELKKIDKQILGLNKKTEEMSPSKNKSDQGSQPKNPILSRILISDDAEAKKNAQNLVKNLRSDKRNRDLAKLRGFRILDKNINEYIEQLMSLRVQNEEKMKNKKKLQVLQRMKQNQMRKLSERKKVEQNQQFLLNLKSSSGSTGPLKQASYQRAPNSKRSPIQEELSSDDIQRGRESEINLNPSQIKDMTPQLNNKKAYLGKLRNFSGRKNKDRQDRRSEYQQALG